MVVVCLCGWKLAGKKIIFIYGCSSGDSDEFQLSLGAGQRDDDTFQACGGTIFMVRIHTSGVTRPDAKPVTIPVTVL